MSGDRVNEFIEQATLSLQGGHFTQALEFAQAAIEVAPSSADAHLLRAVALSHTRQPQAADEAFRKAIELDPQSAKIRYNFAVHVYGQGNRERAAQLCADALEREPSHAAARQLAERIDAEQRGTPVASLAPPPVATTGGGPPPVGPGAISQIRPGYEVAPSRIAFVQNLGSSWPLIGWALTGIAAVITGFQVIQVGNMFTLIFSGAGPAQNQALSNPILSLIGLLVGLSTIAYAILDLLDRRGNWWWIAAVLCCGAFPGLGVYMLLGRREISNL